MKMNIQFSTPESYLRLSKSKLSSAFLTLVFLLFLLPISVGGGARGALPIDLVISDFLSVILAFLYLFSFAPYSKKEPLLLLQLLFVFYALILAVFSTVNTSDLTPLFSFSKFSKVILAFFAGYALSNWFGRDQVLYSGVLDNAVVIINLLCNNPIRQESNLQPLMDLDLHP